MLPGILEIIKKNPRLCAVLLAVLVIPGVYFLRSPVLIVTDASFYQLYGSRRLNLAVARTSFELFRRVIPVPVSEHAGPDVIALVVEEVSRSPHAVLFPKRYIDGARVYSSRHPRVPALVMWGRTPLPPASSRDTALVFVRTDTAADLYRAGLSAAVLAPGHTEVLFFTDGTLQDRYRQAFSGGLRRQGFAGEPLYLDASLDHFSYDAIGCVVVAGPALRFLERNLAIPVILFSWVDPALTPRSVRIIFNDSPLALASRSLRAFSPASGEILVASRPVVISGRAEERRDIRALRTLVRQEL
ncbi:MAG: hypothetical protein FWC64_12355 [Treponema sp.]|nr:hypothetical protein [Treponema sp.]